MLFIVKFHSGGRKLNTYDSPQIWCISSPNYHLLFSNLTTLLPDSQFLATAVTGGCLNTLNHQISVHYRRGGWQLTASTSSSNRTKTSWTTQDWKFLVRRHGASSWLALRKIRCTVFEWSATILKARAISATRLLKRPWVSSDQHHPENCAIFYRSH